MAVLVLTVNLKWNRLNFVCLHTDKLLMSKTPNFRGCPGGDLCSSFWEGVLALLAFAGLPRNAAR